MNQLSKSNLRAFFACFSKAAPHLPKATGNLYEVFVFLEVCETAERLGFSISMVAPGPTFVFRASPGNLGAGFGYAQLTNRAGQCLELHNGIEVLGHSGMQHEIDVLVLKNSHSAMSPNSLRSSLVLTVECKHYDSVNRLKGEVRKVVGAVTDWSDSAHPSKLTGHSQGCLHCGRGFDALFATSVLHHLRPDIEAFLATYDVAPCFGALPGRGGMSHLSQTLREVLLPLA